MALAIAWALILGLFSGDAIDVAAGWWNSSTFNHCLLIPPIIFWLVWQRRPQLEALAPAAWWPGLFLVGAGALGWLIGEASGVAGGGRLRRLFGDSDEAGKPAVEVAVRRRVGRRWLVQCHQRAMGLVHDRGGGRVARTRLVDGVQVVLACEVPGEAEHDRDGGERDARRDGDQQRGEAGTREAGRGARDDRVAEQVAEPPAALAGGEEGGEADRAVLDDPRRRAQGDGLRGRGLAVAALSGWMLLMTAAYFHTWFEKLTGSLLAAAAVYAVYFLPRAVPPLRQIWGLPGV